MTIPLYTLLFVYVVFLAIFFVFLLINLYHIIMTASLTVVSFFTSFFIFTASFLILYMTWYLLQAMDWNQALVELPALSGFFTSLNF